MARHVFHCPLRWSDMDAFGHVNNAVFLRYLEEARIDLTFRRAPGRGEGSLAAGSVVARHEIDYLRPLPHGYEPVTIETWVTKIGAATITYAYEIKDDAQVYARASTVVVPYNLAEGRPRRLTPQERAFFEAYRDEPAVPAAVGTATGSGAPDAAPASDASASDASASDASASDASASDASDAPSDADASDPADEAGSGDAGGGERVEGAVPA